MSQVQVPPVAITTGRDSKGQAEPRLPSRAEVDEYEREATELGAYREHSRNARDAGEADRSRHSHVDDVRQPRNNRATWYHAISSFSTHYIRLSVPHDDCRDHLGKSYLGLRTLSAAYAGRTYISGVCLYQV